MEPVSISTLALIAGFMTAPAPTRLEEWRPRLYQTPRPKVTATTHLLINPNVAPAPSEELAAATANQGLVLDRLSSLALELELYSALNEGWDGPDSRAPSQGDIMDAQALVAKLPPGLPIPKPMLSSSGNVGLYWDAQKIFADIALEGDGRFSLFTRRKSGNRKETFADAVEIDKLTPEWLKKNLAVLLDA